mgnify:CR=1 FL=1
MQKKSVLSLCIAMALSGNSYAETTLSEKNRPSNSCPTNISVLTEAQKAKLPAECLKEPSFLEEQWEWVAGGVAAVAAAVGLAAGGGGGGGDGGDGGSSAPVDDVIKNYSNGVTWNETKKTISFGGITWAYTANQDGTYSLTDPASGKTMLLKKWVVDPASNAVTLSGISTDGSKAWLLDGAGKVSFTDAANWHEGNNSSIDTSGGSTSGTGNSGSIVDGDSNTINNNGDTNGTNGGTGMQVDGNTNDINNNGNNSGTNGGTGTKVDGDGNTIDNKGNNTADGSGSAGTDVDGNNNAIINGGENSGTNGGTGTKVDGNDNRIDNNGSNTADGEGSKGTDATGDGNAINNNGDNSGANGGTGTKVDGDSNSIDNKGNNTADGSGSAGTDVDGNNNAIINGGENSGINGGTGTKVDGDGNDINNKGNNTADGQGSAGTAVDGNSNTISNGGDNTATNGGTGTDVAGDKNKINNEGDTSATNGGTGTKVDGNDNIIDNKGNIAVDGQGSTGSDITGTTNTINNNGNSTVTDGATGTKVSGDGNAVINTGELSTASSDGSKPSTGVDVSGNNNQITQNGKLAVGDYSIGIKIDGKGNTVNLASADMSVTGQQATGANISGESNTVMLTGNMVVNKDQKSPLAADNFYNASTGIHVSGTNNNVTLDGQLKVVADTEKTTSAYTMFNGSQEHINGVVVTGDNNRVDLKKGIQLTGETNAMGDVGTVIANKRTGVGDTSVISVNGASSVYVSGNTTIDGDFSAVGFGPVLKATNGGYIELTENSNFNTAGITALSDYGDDGVKRYISVASADNGGSIVNNGIITSNDVMFVNVMGSGSQFTNNGTMTIQRTNKFSPSANPASSVMAENGGTAVNKGTINAEIANKVASIDAQDYFGMAGDPWVFNVQNEDVQAMSARGAGSIIVNDTGATINVHGTGDGMVASQGATAINKGSIVMDSMWVAEGDTTSQTGVSTSRAIDYGVGMGVGSTNYSYTSANNTAVNQGTITVKNAGVGMAAVGYNGNQVINQGTINLEKDENYDPSKPLVGMAVYGGATAINDTRGVININAENGKAFYTDGNKDNRIINRGHINVGAGVPPEADNSVAVETPEFADGTVLSGINTLTETTSVLSDSTVSNTGTVNGTGRLYVEGTFDNQNTGIIDSPLSVSGNKGVINNSGTINAYIITSTSGKVVNNGSATGGAEMWGDSRIINSGNFTLGKATDAKDAHRLDLKNNSVFENAAGGVVVGDNNKNAIHLNNNSTLKNDKGATMNFTASSNAAGVNIWGGTADFINDGTVSATGVGVVGSSSNAGANKATFWNQDDGVMNFTATTSGQSAVSLTHNNYVGVNDGTMNISGNGAIGMKGSQNAQLVNNGTINLGTAGTTESGMVAMQLDAKTTAPLTSMRKTLMPSASWERTVVSSITAR